MLKVYQTWGLQIRNQLREGDIKEIAQITGLSYDKVRNILGGRSLQDAKAEKVFDTAVEKVRAYALAAKTVSESFLEEKALEEQIAEEQAQIAADRRARSQSREKLIHF